MIVLVSVAFMVAFFVVMDILNAYRQVAALKRELAEKNVYIARGIHIDIGTHTYIYIRGGGGKIPLLVPFGKKDIKSIRYEYIQKKAPNNTHVVEVLSVRIHT